MNSKITTAIIALLTCGLGFAQQRPTHYTDSTGTLYWRKSVPVYLFVSDAPDGEKEQLSSKSTPKYGNPFYLDTEGVNYVRTREAVDPDTRQVIPNTEVKFEIYADGIAPATSIAYEHVNKHVSGGTIYYQAGLEVLFKAMDYMSGVRILQYSVNGDSYSPFEKPVIFRKDGKFTVNYFSEDQVGNVEEIKAVHFVIDSKSASSDLNINGITEAKVISTGSKMYILAEDSLSGVAAVYYKFDDQQYVKYQGAAVPFTQLDEGDHTITYYSEDFVKNVEPEKTFAFFLDKSAPLMVADVLGDRFVVGDEVYFSGRTKLKLTAVDNKVGVKEIRFSVDGTAFSDYNQPFYLPSVSGVHIIRYYSVDNLDNSTTDSKNGQYLGQGGVEEFKHNVTRFYMDLTGPVIDHQISDFSFTRGDTLFIGPYSRIALSGKDPESGLRELSYSMNEDAGEIIYTQPFTLNKNDEGYNDLNYYGYDNVNNRNVGKFSFYLDATLPDIFIQFNTGMIEGKDNKQVYPANAGIFLSATDKTSGVSAVTYSLDGLPFKSYAGLITGMKKGKHTLVVKAKDMLNNEATKELTFYLK